MKTPKTNRMIASDQVIVNAANALQFCIDELREIELALCSPPPNGSEIQRIDLLSQSLADLQNALRQIAALSADTKIVDINLVTAPLRLQVIRDILANTPPPTAATQQSGSIEFLEPER